VLAERGTVAISGWFMMLLLIPGCRAASKNSRKSNEQNQPKEVFQLYLHVQRLLSMRFFGAFIRHVAGFVFRIPVVIFGA